MSRFFLPRGRHLLAGERVARIARCLAGLWVALVAAAVLRAHDPGISVTQVRVLADRVEITTGFAPADVQQLLPAEARTEDRFEAEEFQGARAQLDKIARELWEMRAGETLVPPRDPRPELVAGDNISFHVTFSRGQGVREFILRAPKLPELPAGHREFVIVADEAGSTLTKKLLRAADFTIHVSLDAPAPGRVGAAPVDETSWWEFIQLGVEHIWTGYDHLLFLFALLIVCRSFRSILTIISCFTLAHSITLAVATLGWVTLPGKLVESAIAASIVFVGAENLWRKGAEPRGRGALTFAFGLIHGFGFASVLSDLGVGQSEQGIAMPLFTFNLGVELGQIVIAAIVLPIVWQLRKKEWFVRQGVTALSVVVVLAGLYWLIDRTVLG